MHHDYQMDVLSRLQNPGLACLEQEKVLVTLSEPQSHTVQSGGDTLVVVFVVVVILKVDEQASIILLPSNLQISPTVT